MSFSLNGFMCVASRMNSEAVFAYYNDEIYRWMLEFYSHSVTIFSQGYIVF